MKKILIYYDFIVVSLVALASLLNAQSYVDLISAIPFIPLVAYFGIFIFPHKRRAIILPTKTKLTGPPLLIPTEASENEADKPSPVEGEILEEEKEGVDSNRRMFLKLIGSAGLSVFFFALFTKKAEAAFFGSAPGPGTVALKNIAGEKIDPAEKRPTDGYNITEIDDSSTPIYYGYVNKDGAWFIIKEGSDGTYRYAKGSSGFSTNWTNRSSLSYGYFDEIF